MLANLENKSQVIQRGENTAAWLDKPIQKSDQKVHRVENLEPNFTFYECYL